jgi:hypothetical protein
MKTIQGSVQVRLVLWNQDGEGGLVAEAKTTLKAAQNLNDSRLLYPATFLVDNDINSVVL